jgi:dipeptidyl aminopeptidase/acylaminoacyl peptidase
MADDNVLYEHARQLELLAQQHMKPLRLYNYPYERHGITTAEADSHFNTVLIRHLRQLLD